MPEFSNEVQINIKAGEDYTAQITWESDEGEPVPVVGPGRMEIRNDAKALLVHLEDTADISATQGYLSFSTASGVIGIYFPKAVTKTMPTGRHFFDMFVNYERFTVWSDDPQYKPQWGDYHIRAVVSGTVVVHPAITEELPNYPSDTPPVPGG
jgi:hypothetical protein